MCAELSHVSLSACLGEVLFTQEQIADRVRELAALITADYQDTPFVVMSVLKGSVFFLTDITRHIDLPIEMEFVRISTYRGGTSPQLEPLFAEHLFSVEGRHVLVVEDILDTGATLQYAIQALLDKGAASVRTCVLLAKQGYETRIEARPDYIGFCIPNVFVVGYGLDYEERFRNLPFVAVLRQRNDGDNG